MSSPDFSAFRDYGGRTLRPVRPAYQPWRTALEATAIGILVGFVLGFVAGFFGAVYAVGGGLRHTTDTGVYVLAFVVWAIVQLGVVLVQAMHVRRRGGVHAFGACFAGVLVSMAVGWAAGMVVGFPYSWVASTAAQVVAIALISERTD